MNTYLPRLAEKKILKLISFFPAVAIVGPRQQLAAILPDWAEMYFYRTHAGTEADLLITKAGKPEILIEIKFSTTPKPSKGFHIAMSDLDTKHHFFICPVESGFSLPRDIRVLGYRQIAEVFNPTID